MPLSRARQAAAAAFAAQGFVFISLTTRLPDLQDKFDLSELELSGLLLMMVLLGGGGSVLAERLAAQQHSAVVLRGGLIVSAIAIPILILSPAFLPFVAALAVYGVGLGVVDATSNMQAVAVERAYGRPILPSFHGAWTAGGIAGAGLTLATGSLPFEFAAVAAVAPAIVSFAPFLRRDVAVADLDETDIPWRPIVLVGLGMVIFYMVDTAAQTWGASYLDTVFDTPSNLVALATFPYLVASLVLRLSGDGLVLRYGAVRVLRCGTLVGFVGLVIVVSSPTWPIAILGFTITGAGVAVIAPLSFSAAARIAGGSPARVDAVIARFNQFNYVGALLGAVLTGAVGKDSLRFGFAVPMILILAMLPLARAFAPTREPESAPTA